MKKGTHPFLILGLAVAVTGALSANLKDNSVTKSEVQNITAQPADINSELLTLKEQGEEQVTKLTNSLAGTLSGMKEDALPQAYLTITKELSEEAKSSATNQACLDLFNKFRSLKVLDISDSSKAARALQLFAETNLKLRKVCSASEYNAFFKNEYSSWISSLMSK